MAISDGKHILGNLHTCCHEFLKLTTIKADYPGSGKVRFLAFQSHYSLVMNGTGLRQPNLDWS